MRYSNYDNNIMSLSDIEKYKKIFERDILNKQQELKDFIDRANKRIKWINECESNKKYCVLGNTFRNGRNKDILLIIEYPDKTQRDERYSFSKVAELRVKLNELKEKYSGVDWSRFDNEF